MFTFDTGVAQQEPNVWTYGGYVWMLTSGQQLWRATDPRGPWTGLGYVLGNGQGGESVFAAHAGLYIEGTTLYLTYHPMGTGNLALATADMSAPTVWTKYGTLLPNAAGLPSGVSVDSQGNSTMIKYQGRYLLFYEAIYGTNSWQTAMFSASSPFGPWKMEAAPLRTLNAWMALRTNPGTETITAPANVDPEGYMSTCSVGPIIEENGQLTMLYHSQGISVGGTTASEIYRAASTDGGFTWTVDNGGWPLYRRSHPMYEIDQVADPSVCNFGGVWWAFWTGANNNDGKFYVRCAPLSPTMLMWDGYGWAPVDQVGGYGDSHRGLLTRSRYAVGSGSPIFHFDDVPVDPGATAAFALTLPAAALGSEVRVHNISTSTGTVAPAAKAGDTILGSNPAITAGQAAHYFCRRQNYWTRQG